MEIVNKLTCGWWKKDATSVPVPPRPPTALEERQQLLAHHVRNDRTVGSPTGCASTAAGADWQDEGSMGDACERESVSRWSCTGTLTPLSLYSSLYEHPESIIFLDDCDSAVQEPPALGILQSRRCEGEKIGNADFVDYNSLQFKVPSSFRFERAVRVRGQRVALPKNYAFEAVLSRVDQFDWSAATRNARHDAELARQGFAGRLTADECMEVVDYIAGFSTRESGVSLRLLEPSVQEGALRKGRRHRLEAQLVAGQHPRDRAEPRPDGTCRQEFRPRQPAAGRAGLPERCRRRRRRGGRSRKGAGQPSSD